MRTLMIGVLLGLALGTLGGGRDWIPAVGAQAEYQPPPKTMLPGGRVREFRLVARPGKWEITPGTVLDAWTYNGQVPGPELRVREGDLVRVVVKNALPVPTTIHWHGIDLDWKMDGPPGTNQAPIEPGKTFTYEFVAIPAGTRMYHSHVDPEVQMELGMYGALIVEPREPEPVRYDREVTYILDELAAEFTPRVALGREKLPRSEFGNGRGGALQYDFFLMNGKAGSAIEPIHMKANERVRVRLINVGSLPHAMHIHGHVFKIVATDGNPVPPAAQLRKDTVLLGPGERVDLELFGYNPGVWMFHCHMTNHGANGMMTTIQYEGFKPVQEHPHLPTAAPRAQSSPATPGVPGGASDGRAAAGSAPHHAAAAAPPRAARAQPPRRPREVIVEMLDNRFAPAAVTVPVGARVTWINKGLNAHTTTGFDIFWDSPNLAAGGRYSQTFTKPGTYRYVCRQHLLSGMTGTIEVSEKEVTTPDRSGRLSIR